MKACVLTQAITHPDLAPQIERSVIPGGKSRAINLMKRSIAMPTQFFYDLNKKSEATLTRGSAKISYSLLECPDVETAKKLLVDVTAQ